LTEEYIYIVLELAERGSLFDVLKDQKGLSFSKKLKFAEDAARVCQCSRGSFFPCC
jgi:hypothetical protein